MNKEIEKILKELEHHDILNPIEDIYLVDYIKTLQQKNKQLKEQLDKYENPDDMTLMMMWATDKVKDENKQLKEEIKELQRIVISKQEDYLIISVGKITKVFKLNDNKKWINEVGGSNE